MNRLRAISELSLSGETQSDIARMFNLTRARINQLFDQCEDAGLPVKRRHPVPEFVTRTCECGKTFTCKRNSKKTRCCPRGGPWSDKQFLELTCKQCGKSFTRTRRLHSICQWLKCRNSYCGRECYHAASRGPRSKPQESSGTESISTCT